MSNFKQFIVREFIEVLEFNEKYLKLFDDEKLERLSKSIKKELYERMKKRKNKIVEYWNEKLKSRNLNLILEARHCPWFDCTVLTFKEGSLFIKHYAYGAFTVNSSNNFSLYSNIERRYLCSWLNYHKFISKVEHVHPEAVDTVKEFIETHPNFNRRVYDYGIKNKRLCSN